MFKSLLIALMIMTSASASSALKGPGSAGKFLKGGKSGKGSKSKKPSMVNKMKSSSGKGNKNKKKGMSALMKQKKKATKGRKSQNDQKMMDQGYQDNQQVNQPQSTQTQPYQPIHEESSW